MLFDPNNKVVQLCVSGMNAELEGRAKEEEIQFQEAWELASDDLEKFAAAHYIARNHKSPLECLRWNMEALNHAKAISNKEVEAYYPSLYLNVAKSFETVGDLPEATRYFKSAAESCKQLPDGKYGEMIRSGISDGLKRVGADINQNSQLTELIDRWCKRKDLRPLSIVLPAFTGNLGTEIDKQKLISALSFLSATRCLPDEEQEILTRMIAGS